MQVFQQAQQDLSESTQPITLPSELGWSVKVLCTGTTPLSERRLCVLGCSLGGRPGVAVTEMMINGENIAACNEADRKKWNGTITTTNEKIHVQFTGDAWTATMTPHGPQVFRAEDKGQLIIYGNIENPVTVEAAYMPNSNVWDGFCCVNAFHYYHPWKPAATLHVATNPTNDIRKVSWNGGKLTGEWALRYANIDVNLLKKLPKGMDYDSPILDVKFHHKGDEDREVTTLYALVLGTNNVWRAVGRRTEDGTEHFDIAEDLKKNADWSITLVAVGKFNF